MVLYKSVPHKWGKLNCICDSLANGINRFGDSVDVIVFTWLTYTLTESAAFSALVFAANRLPTVFLQPLTGVWMELRPKRRIMVVTDLLRGLLVGTALGAVLIGLLGNIGAMAVDGAAFFLSGILLSAMTLKETLPSEPERFSVQKMVQELGNVSLGMIAGASLYPVLAQRVPARILLLMGSLCSGILALIACGLLFNHRVMPWEFWNDQKMG